MITNQVTTKEFEGERALQIDYYSNPVLGRSSVGQLLQREGLMGFSNLVWVSGDWRGLASPFCRLGRETPEVLVCEAEFIRQESEHAAISAAFFGPDSIGIEVEVQIPIRLHSGAPGKIHHNGGTAHQQWMAFDAFRGGARLEQLSPGVIVASNGSYSAVFVGEGLHLAEDGNGWSMDLRPGKTFLGTGVAYQSTDVALTRARSALATLERDGSIEPTRMRLRQEWNELFGKFPFPPFQDPTDESIARNGVWCVYSNLAAPEGALKRPAIIGAKIQYPGVFPWDSAFAALACKEADPALARDQIELYTDMIREKGSGKVGEMTALHSGGGVQFPLLAWSAWRIHSARPDESFLDRVYEPLAMHADWWLTAEFAKDGIPVYERVVCLDDSPRFDMFASEGRMSLREPVYGGDLIALCAWDQIHLALMAHELGRTDDAVQHQAHAERLVDFLDEKIYDVGLKRFVDLGANSGRKGTVNTPMNHFPAFLSRFPERRRAAAEALSPAGPFWGKYGLATVSPEESSFDPCRIWRGPIWFSVNFLCAQACSQMGFAEISDQIAKSSKDILRANLPLPNGIMEYYNYQTGEGSGAHHIATMSAAPYLSFVMGHHLETTRILTVPTDRKLPPARKSLAHGIEV